MPTRSRRTAPVSQADITRMIKAALAAGIGVERIAGVKVTREGAVLLFGEPATVHTDSHENEWDEVLK